MMSLLLKRIQSVETFAWKLLLHPTLNFDFLPLCPDDVRVFGECLPLENTNTLPHQIFMVLTRRPVQKNDSSESKPNIKKSRSACEGNVRAGRAASTVGVCVFCVFSRLSSHESSPQICTHVSSSCGFPSAAFTRLTNALCSDVSSSAWLLALVRTERCCCCWTGVGGSHLLQLSLCLMRRQFLTTLCVIWFVSADKQNRWLMLAATCYVPVSASLLPRPTTHNWTGLAAE